MEREGFVKIDSVAGVCGRGGFGLVGGWGRLEEELGFGYWWDGNFR